MPVREWNADEINLTPAKRLSADTVRMERILPGPIERVWSYLVDEDKRRQWFAGGAMQPVAGSKTRLLFNHANFAGEPTPEKYKEMDEGGFSFEVEIRHFEPPHKLVYSWPASPGISEVSFELTPQGKDVRLVLVHTRLPNARQMANVASGWHAHLTVLQDILSGREPKGFWTDALKLEEEYGRAFGSDVDDETRGL